MKYIVLIIDGAAGWPLPEYGAKTCLELARTPNLDGLAAGGRLGLTRTVPKGMEPSSACACMSLLGYDPAVYYRGRAAIEAVSMGVPVAGDEAIFRCNLVAIKDGKMGSYAAGHISSAESHQLIESLNERLGSREVQFYPGVGYRHLLRLKGHPETLAAVCTPPHDIPDRPVAGYEPHGAGSGFLVELMRQAETVLKGHPVNVIREKQGKILATDIWPFWGSAQVPPMPSFKEAYGLSAALTSGVDLLRGLGLMAGMKILEIDGVTDGLDNDWTAQVEGALGSLEGNDLVVIHVEAPDEAGHAGSVADKVKAIEQIDSHMLGRIRRYKSDGLRLLVAADHPTPIAARTHVAEPVPCLLWGEGFGTCGAARFTEAEAGRTGILIEPGCNIMRSLVNGHA